MKRATLIAVLTLCAVAACGLRPQPAAARPLYFATFTSLYGLSSGQDLYACGVCHRKWEGTGARNPYGTAVEAQLYVGKTITEAILDIAGDDTDGDGFSNGDEISIWGTLPGYSCSNYTLAINPPPFFQSIITPMVASCLQPQDLLIDPTQVAFLTQVNQVASAPVQLVNNGTTLPITVSNYAMLAGSSATLGVSGPSLPIVIPVGQSATLTLAFSPTVTTFATGTLRITSDDPDQPTMDIPVTGIGVVKNLAPADQRAACFGDVEHRVETFARTSFKEWSRCYLDELQGIACDTGRRDLKLARAEQVLRSFVGGAKDRSCAGKSLSPSLLDLPATCGAPCDSIALTTIGDWASCLVCRQQAATNAMLDAAVGTTPPDVPSNQLGRDAYHCNRGVVAAEQNGIRKIEHALGACALSNVTAAVPVDCATALAGDISGRSAAVDAAFDRCRDTSGMLGCRFAMTPDPQCLGTTADGIATDLVGAVFDTAD